MSTAPVPPAVRIDLPADLGFSSTVRDLAEALFRAAGFSAAWRSRLKLVADELFMNAVKYGSTPGQSRVWIECQVGADKAITFAVSDDGTGKMAVTPDELRGIMARNGSDGTIAKTSGRGLAMIARLWTDGIFIEKNSHGGLTVRFVKNAEDGPPPAMPVAPAMTPVSTGAPAPVNAGISTVTVALEGDIDQNSIASVAERVEKAIAGLPAHAILELDFTQVTYINSTFIGQLAFWYNAAARRAASLRIRNAAPSVRDVLDLVGLNHIVPIQ